MVRRVNFAVSAGLGFVVVLASVAILTTDRAVEAALVATVVVGAVGAAGILRHIAVRDLRALAVAEAKLRESEARFAGILSIAPNAIITTDQGARIVHFNHEAEAMFGWRATEIIGEPLGRLLPPAAATVHDDHMAGFAQSPDVVRVMGKRREVSGRRRNGEEFPAEVSISKLSTDRGLLFTAVVRDITAQRRLALHEHTLAIAGIRLAATLDFETTVRLVVDLPVPIAGDWCLLDLLDTSGEGIATIRRIGSSHADAKRHLALRSIEARGLDWDSPWEAIDVLRSGEPRMNLDVSRDWLEAHAIDADELRDLDALGLQSCVAIPLKARERVIGALTVGRSDRRLDASEIELVTELAAQAALAIESATLYRRAQRAVAGRDHVLAVVSHDLRTPAAAIAMCARTLLEHLPADEAERQALYATIVESSDWMHRLLQDLLDAASIDAGRLAVDIRPHPVAPLLAAAESLFAESARTAGVQLHFDCQAGLPDVLIDDGRIVQLLGNLIANALRFTPRGGRVDVTAGAGERGVILTVRDTGIGIGPDHLDHVFDRFWQATSPGASRGAGLGLAIAKGIADAHRGRIWVESEPGSGSTFHVELPAA